MRDSNMKKIAILGGNPETGALVEVANQIGLDTAVLDPYPHSPAKRKAAIAHTVDVKNLDAVDQIIRDEGIVGVLVGVADPLVPFYQKICARNQFHCYATETSIKALTSKANFAQTCVAHGLAVIPVFDVDLKSSEDTINLNYPVVVKPVDAGAGLGMSICHNSTELRVGVAKALAVSIRKELRVEKLMQCDDMFAYYTFVDGIAYLSALADRHKTHQQEKLSPVCVAAEYPSRYSNRFIQEVHPKLLSMFESLGIKNGVLLIQFFVDSDNFYAYDPGFRLQGEAPHIYLKHFNQFDHREMLLNFAMTGSMWSGDFSKVNDHSFKGKFATTIWVLLRVGRIAQIQGIEAIRAHPCVIDVLQRFYVGEELTTDMMGTERQVFARIYTTAQSADEAKEILNFIHSSLLIVDELGVDMVLDRYKKSHNWENS